MIIIGGLGSILGSFLGAAFIILVPILLTNIPHWLGIKMSVALQKEIELMVFGGLIILLPDRRAARAGAALADREGEAPPVALPVLRTCSRLGRRLGYGGSGSQTSVRLGADGRPPGRGAPMRSDA